MKFISKNSNLNIVLRPGMSAQPLTGTPAVPTLFVRFKDGIANVEQEELVQMMLNHPGFNNDFIAADDLGTDPYAYLRQDSEPTHVIEEIRFGHPVSRNVPPVKGELPVEIKKMIQEQATAIAKEMLPSMVAATLKEIVAESKKEPTVPAVEEETAEEVPSSVGFSYTCDECDFVAKNEKDWVAKNSLRMHKRAHKK